MRYYQLDNDTKKYIKRLNYNGYRVPTDIYSIDQFIRGLKDLGVYGNLIEAWSFRKNQNAGTGSTVFALRDGFNNGTINNISTARWDDRGLICTANATSSLSNYITANLKPNSLPTASLFSVFMNNSPMENFSLGFPYASSLTDRRVYNSASRANSLSIAGFGNNGNVWGCSLNNTNNTSEIAGNSLYKIVKGSLSPSNVIVESRNISKTLTTSSTSNTIGPVVYDYFVFCGRTNDHGYLTNSIVESSNGVYGVGFHGTQIFSCFFDINVNFVSFETLFKNTIGKGIDLP